MSATDPIRAALGDMRNRNRALDALQAVLDLCAEEDPECWTFPEWQRAIERVIAEHLGVTDE